MSDTICHYLSNSTKQSTNSRTALCWLPLTPALVSLRAALFEARERALLTNILLSVFEGFDEKDTKDTFYISEIYAVEKEHFIGSG